jgi:isoleucyl-tRNA synthetase
MLSIKNNTIVLKMKYQEYKLPNLSETAKEVLAFWEANSVFEKSITSREGSKPFVFYEGPPSANGKPGIHHVMARTIKDIFCRYKTLQGFQVHRKGGWDTHGLPIELQVEKELGITKEDIGKKISVEDYNRHCRETVMKYKSLWDELTIKVGYWVDLDNPYVTFENEYIESCWALLKRLYDKNLLYKGYTIQPYSPAAGTGLSSHELNQPGCYKNVKDTSIVAQFKVKGTDHDYLLAWTTTPWTLPSNAALAVGAAIDYVKVKTHNQYTNLPVNVIMAKSALSRILTGKYVPIAQYNEDTENTQKIPYTILEEWKGENLVGLQYEQLMPYVQPLSKAENAFKVVIGDFVSTEDGTGIVHIAPTFGADDFRVGQKNDIPAILVLDENGNEVPLVNKQGKFVKEVSDYAGLYVKNYDGQDESDPNYRSTDVLIAIKLKEENKAFEVKKYEHSYPHCWRTDKPVLYYPMESWFIRTTACKDRLVELNKTINWKPASTGEGRFGNWLENLVDWNLSRSRYWGTPLPIWRTEDGKEEICIGSIAELSGHIEKSIQAGLMKSNPISKADLDLHRPFVDDIILISPSGKPMKRELDLIDVWFDSGAMPYAQWHYPFENEDTFKKSYPADFISEGVDQTRGWFFTLHAIAGMVYDSVAFKNVVSTGLVLDENGNKMSKRLGNVIDPFEALNKYGADAVRWYMLENAPAWDNLKFSFKGVEETIRKFFGTLQNTYNFFALYANLDDWSIDEQNIVPVSERSELDRWVLSCLHTTVKMANEAYDNYDATAAARAIQYFVTEQLSNWYVRLSRRRFWKGEMGQDKKAAYETLFECLNVVAQLSSPIAPFFSEWLYQNLNAPIREKAVAHKTPLSPISVHLTLMTQAEAQSIDPELEKRMEMAQQISSLVHSLRKNQKIKVRQPLQKILIPILNSEMQSRIELVKDLIMTEVNVKAVEFVSDDSGVVQKLVKPNFKELGKVFKQDINAVKVKLEQLSQNQIKTFEKEGQITLTLDSGKAVLIQKEYVEFVTKDLEGWLVAKEGNLTVALDITITEALRQEGIARDLVNRIQNIRKDQGLEVQDKINVRYLKASEIVNASILAHKDYISEETQAISLEMVDSLANATELEIDEFKLSLEVGV